jgi:AraC family transcriptional regulator
MDLLGHGGQKYPSARVATSSALRDWSGVEAELRCHAASELPLIHLQQMEVAIATKRSYQAVVNRTGDGLTQETFVQPGTIWFCPIGVTEENVRITAPIEVLHIYLPALRFNQLSEVHGRAANRAPSIRYMAGVEDALIRQIGIALLDEIRFESAAGRVLVESLAVSLTARLASKYSEEQPVLLNSGYKKHVLDDVRIRRVIEYIAEHLEDDIGLDELASVACLSPFHFSRMFRNTMGVPPYRYLTHVRLERAKS